MGEQHLYFTLCCQPRPAVEPVLILDVPGWASLARVSLMDTLGALCGLVSAGMVSIDGDRLILHWLDCVVLPSQPTAAQRERAKMTPAVREAVFERDGRACRACGITDNLHIDHVVPISRGGLTVMENLAVLCGSCNASKGALPWDVWLEARA